MIALWLALAGCLERTSGESVPLDPRYYEGHDQAAGPEDHPHEEVPPGAGAPGSPGGDPSGGTPGDGQPSGGGDPSAQAPWAGVEGEKRTITLEITAPGEGAIQVDVGEPDAASPGGSKRVGGQRLAGPGALALEVPVSVEVVLLQLFQDPDADGPGGEDPFAELRLTPATVTGPVAVALKAGARGQPQGPDAASGAASGAANPTPSGPQDNGPPVGDGPAITLRGEIVASSADAKVQLDFFKPDPSVPGGRTLLGKRRLTPGAFEQALPAGMGPLELEAWIDKTGDGNSPDDAVIRFEGNPLAVGSADIEGVRFVFP